MGNVSHAVMIIIGGIVAAATVIWMCLTIRKALVARRGPTPDVESYLRHDKATGAVAMCVAVSGVLLTTVITGGRATAIWPAAIAGVLVIIAAEGRWPRPTGSIRSAALAPRESRTLIPWFGVVVGLAGIVAAAVVIGFCWMVGNSPDGRTISANEQFAGPDVVTGVVTVDGFPGWQTGLVTVLGGVLLLLTVLFGCRTIIHRPALLGISPELDGQFRKASIDRMVRIVGIAAWITAGNFYENASQVYRDLHWASNSSEPLPSTPAPWLPALAGFMILALYLFDRPRPKAQSTTPAERATQTA